MALAKFRKIIKGGVSPKRKPNGEEKADSTSKKDNKSNG